MITALASALHGYDAATKGVIMAAHAGAYGAIGWALFGLAGLAVMPVCVAWWFVLRGRKQAQVELQCMDTWNPPHPRLRDVLKAHYYTGWLTCLALRYFNYTRTPHLINRPTFWDCRRPTEIATGLTLDIVLLLIFLGGYLAG